MKSAHLPTARKSSFSLNAQLLFITLYHLNLVKMEISVTLAEPPTTEALAGHCTQALPQCVCGQDIF